jgi:hypothetical protein
MNTRSGRFAGACGAFTTSLLLAGGQNVACAATVQQATDFKSLAESDLLVLGPVERVEREKFQVQVLGQSIDLPAYLRSVDISHFTNKMVAVYGSIKQDGTLQVRYVSELSAVSYVPGATELYLKGVVTTVDHSSALARLGALSIEYSGALHTLRSEDVESGKVVSFSGLKFSGVDALYADNGVATAASQSGSDKIIAASQSGSDKIIAASQSGSDKIIAASQSGSDRIIAARQSGSDRIVAASQSGSDRIIAARQSGSDKIIAASQSGSDKIIAASQSGSDKIIAASQSGSDKIISASQSGSDKIIAASQSGSDMMVATFAASQRGRD